MKIEGYEVLVKIDKRRTSIASYVKDGIIYVTSPVKLDNAYLTNLIKNNLSRIIEASKPKVKEGIKCYYNELIAGGTFYLFEEAKTISFVKSNKNRYELKNDYLIIYASSEAKIKQVITMMIEDLTMPIIKSAIAKYGKMLNKKVNTVSFKERKRAYAVCMPKSRNIEVGYKIISLREELIDYIIAHEMSHLINPNHSKAFYDTLRSLVPKSDELNKEIKKIYVEFRV